MVKRLISKAELATLRREFSFLEEHGELAIGETERLLALYTVTDIPQTHDSGSKFMQVLFAIGAGLVGLGVLTFIASNWSGLSNTVKLSILFAFLIIFYVGGFSIERRYPRLGRSLYYVGAAIYGAAIFSIGQMFHLGEGSSIALLLWGAGILPLALYLRDKWVALFAALFFFYGGNHFMWDSAGLGLRYALIVLIPVLYWINDQYLKKSNAVFIITTLTALSFVRELLAEVHADSWLQLLGLFLIGVLLVLRPLPAYGTPSNWIGSIAYAGSGISLTFPGVWEDSASDGFSKVIVFVVAVIIIAFLIYLLRKNNLPAILVACALIFRYYADFTFDFMPKSLFFIIGGLILIGFGFWFERSLKERGAPHA